MKIRVYIGLTLLVIIAIFIVQNASVVDIKFLFWTLSMSRSLMIFFVLSIGIVIGWLSSGLFRKKWIY